MVSRASSNKHRALQLETTNYKQTHKSPITDAHYQVPQDSPQELMDSGASENTSGVAGRLQEGWKKVTNVAFNGFNGSMSLAERVGKNADGKLEYWVPNMGTQTLLSASTYASGGAIVLCQTYGAAYMFTPEQSKRHIKFLEECECTKKLIVRDGVYMVDQGYCPQVPMVHRTQIDHLHDEDSMLQGGLTHELGDKGQPIVYCAKSSNARKFFHNVKMNTTNNFQLVLVYLMCGYTIQGMERAITNNVWGGVHPKLTMEVLTKFKKEYGTRLDLIGQTINRDDTVRFGQRSDPIQVCQVGEEVQTDIFVVKFNHQKDNTTNLTSKIKSRGGAIACALTVDVFSYYLSVNFLVTLKQPVIFIKEIFQLYKLFNHKIRKLASDSGVIPPSIVTMTPTMSYLLAHGCLPRIAAPYDHNNGTPDIEGCIKSVTDLVNMAFGYACDLDYLPKLGWNDVETLYTLWAEIVNWAITVLNQRLCPHDSTKTVEEVFTGRRANLQDKKMLPIFCFVLVYFPTGKDPNTNKGSKVGGLYVGPAPYCDGAIRVAICINNRVQVITTVKYSTPSTGETRYLHDTVQGAVTHVTEPYEHGESIFAEEEENLLSAYHNRYQNANLREPAPYKDKITWSQDRELLEQMMDQRDNNHIIFLQTKYKTEHILTPTIVPFSNGKQKLSPTIRLVDVAAEQTEDVDYECDNEEKLRKSVSRVKSPDNQDESHNTILDPLTSQVISLSIKESELSESGVMSSEDKLKTTVSRVKSPDTQDESHNTILDPLTSQVISSPISIKETELSESGVMSMKEVQNTKTICENKSMINKKLPDNSTVTSKGDGRSQAESGVKRTKKVNNKTVKPNSNAKKSKEKGRAEAIQKMVVTKFKGDKMGANNGPNQPRKKYQKCGLTKSKQENEYKKQYNTHRKVREAQERVKRTTRSTRLQAQMGLITSYFKKKEDGKTNASAFKLDEDIPTPFSLKDEPIMEATMTKDVKATNVVRAYTEKMQEIVQTKQALERIVGYNKPSEATEFYKNYIFSEVNNEDNAYNLTVTQQQLEEYQGQLSCIDNELTEHAMSDISAEVEHFLRNDPVQSGAHTRNLESIFRNKGEQDGAALNNLIKRRNIKGCGSLQVEMADYSCTEFKVVARKLIKEPRSKRDTICKYSTARGVPLQDLKKLTEFNESYAFTNNDHTRAFQGRKEDIQLGPLMNDAFSSQGNNCRPLINDDGYCDIINVQDIEEGEECCMAYGPEYWSNHAEKHVLNEELIMKINNYYKLNLQVRRIESAHFADWSLHKPDTMSYYDIKNNTIIEIVDTVKQKQLLEEKGIAWDTEKVTQEEGSQMQTESAMEQMKVNIPGSFQKALVDKVWGNGARTEWETLHDTKTIMQVDAKLAREAVKNGDADVVYMFPIYEKKIKEGKTVYKVRLVCNGKTQNPTMDISAWTPSREELYVLLHIAAHQDYEVVHIDEKRAFLTTDKSDPRVTYARLRGNSNFYEIIKALYGLRSSPADYQNMVKNRFEAQGYTRLGMCKCIFVKREGNNLVMIYDYVDDFIFIGTSREYVSKQIDQLCAVASTTTPVWNQLPLLGMEMTRNRKERTIGLTMEKKIEALYEQMIEFNPNKKLAKRRCSPMSMANYKVKEDDYYEDDPDYALLDKPGINEYMVLVGGLVWIMGIRFDITFATTYCTWYTKQPRQHHLKCVYHCIQYLNTTKHIPLVLGGTQIMEILGFSDASLGTGPQGRSILSQVVRLSIYAGAIHAKTRASTMVYMNVFEAELDGCSIVVKDVARVQNICKEFAHDINQTTIFGDNLAVVDFLHGRGNPKGVRHMQLRMWYLREKILSGEMDIDHLAGTLIVADRLTKVSDNLGHNVYTNDIQGLNLLQLTNKSILSNAKEITAYWDDLKGN